MYVCVFHYGYRLWFIYDIPEHCIQLTLLDCEHTSKYPWPVFFSFWNVLSYLSCRPEKLLFPSLGLYKTTTCGRKHLVHYYWNRGKLKYFFFLLIKHRKQCIQCQIVNASVVPFIWKPSEDYQEKWRQTVFPNGIIKHVVFCKMKNSENTSKELQNK